MDVEFWIDDGSRWRPKTSVGVLGHDAISCSIEAGARSRSLGRGRAVIREPIDTTPLPPVESNNRRHRPTQRLHRRTSMTNGQRHDGPLRRRIVGGKPRVRVPSLPLDALHVQFQKRGEPILKAYQLVARSPRRDDATGEESRGVAAVRSAAAECARKSPPPEPRRGSRDGRPTGGQYREGSRLFELAATQPP